MRSSSGRQFVSSKTRPLTVALVAAGAVVMAACWKDQPAPATPAVVANVAAAAPPRDYAGAYWCSIDDDGYSYAQFPCVIRRANGRWMFAKLGGSVRLRGVARFKPGGDFAFRGEQYCPWGDCTEPVSGLFAADGAGGFKAKLQGTMTVTVRPAEPEAFGGADYGGDGYGAPFEYGSYGGAGYGSQLGRD